MPQKPQTQPADFQILSAISDRIFSAHLLSDFQAAQDFSKSESLQYFLENQDK